LAAWLTVFEALHLKTGRPTYRILFDFWLKIFDVAFGLGVVSGVVMAFQFGTNWSVLSKMSGPIQGPLLSHETFTAFALEASFFGVLHFRPVPRAALVLSVLDRDGCVGDHAFRVPDHGQ
jgi:cytochrome bd ubiquinol oxidase subunit I